MPSKPVHYVQVLSQQSVAYAVYKVLFRAAFCESFDLHTVQTEICLERPTFMGCSLYSALPAACHIAPSLLFACVPVTLQASFTP